MTIINKITLVSIYVAMLSSLAIAQPNSGLDESKPNIAFLGTFHFTGSNDAMSLIVDDLTTRKRQDEIEDLVESLSNYNPTKIILEYPYGDSGLDSLYQLYLKGSHKLTINERQQVGFRLATKMGHNHVYVADYQQQIPFDSLIAFLQKNNQMKSFENMMSDMKTQVIDVWQKVYAESTIKDFFVFINSDNYDAMNKNAYLEYINKTGTEDNYIGSEVVAKWWERNFKIMFNIDSIMEANDRLLVLFGQGHTAILKDFYKNRNDMIYTDILQYLEN